MSAYDRTALIERALLLEWLSIAWMIVEGAVAIGSGIAAHSLSLLAFGFDSIIELISAGVLLWRLIIELRRGDEFSEVIEQQASKASGALLLLLAFYVVGSAVWSLWQRHGEEFSMPGLLVTLVAIPSMYGLAKSKLRIADTLKSRALRADAVEAITCGYLSCTVLLGLVAQAIFHVWWIDGITSLAIVYFLIKEGREAWEGRECCSSAH